MRDFTFADVAIMPAMLINCVAYQDGRKIAEIPPDEISTYLAKPGTFVWVALAEPGPGELAAMQHEFGLHELAVEDARHGHQRPKIEEYDDLLFTVMHTVEVEPDGELNVGEVDVFVGRNFVLSVRNRTRKGFKEVRARLEREPELLKHGAGFVLYALMDAVVDRYFPVLDALESELERVEESMFANAAGRTSVESLYKLKHKAMVLKHAVAPLLEASGKLWGGRVPQTCANTQEYFRDVFDHLSRINQSIDSLREMVTTATSVNLALVTISENEVTKRLAAYAALIGIPTMIAGIYGMNFEHMPELRWALGYPVTLAGMFLIDAWLFWKFKKAKWL
jgi:magnesium transporter